LVHRTSRCSTQEAHFRRTLSERLQASVLDRAGGTREGKITVRTVPEGQIVALGSTLSRLRSGDANRIEVRVEPAHGQVAPHLLRHLIRVKRRLNPGQRIKLVVPQWQDAVIEAARDAGCVQRLEYHRMGLVL
jgi:hypothetical protein